MSDNNKKIEEITIDELEKVSGGKGIQMMKLACPGCGTINEVNIMADKYTCASCHKTNYIMG